MRTIRSALLGLTLLVGLAAAPVSFAKPPVIAPTLAPKLAVGPQYDTTQVDVAPADFDRFTDSLVATFGGSKSKLGVFQVTPTPGQTISQLVFTPSGTISVFGSRTPIPRPFGDERTGYLVTDMDTAIKVAREHGADVIVDTRPNPIGLDAVIRWSGNVNMQIYWHTQAPHYAPLERIPENRIYISPSSLHKFVHGFVKFSNGKVVSDVANAPGIEVGQPGGTYRRVRIESGFGRITVLVTNGHLPYPFGRETTGYEVANLSATLQKAKAAGVIVLVPPFTSDGRDAAIVQFPGGYIAEIHANVAK